LLCPPSHNIKGNTFRQFAQLPHFVYPKTVAWILSPPEKLRFSSTRTEACMRILLALRLSNILVEILQVLAHGHHELVGVRAIDNAMVIAHGEADNVAHGN
jgi:hypothetical protein